VHHWYQRHWWQIAAGINDNVGKFATGINVLLILVANLPLVSTTPTANNHQQQAAETLK
jgi:hypothetical protein